jgi:hypothetical protein
MLHQGRTVRTSRGKKIAIKDKAFARPRQSPRHIGHEIQEVHDGAVPSIGCAADIPRCGPGASFDQGAEQSFQLLDIAHHCHSACNFDPLSRGIGVTPRSGQV